MLGASDIPDDDAALTGKKRAHLSDRRFSGVDGDELSEMTVISHNETYEHIMKQREEDDSYVHVSIPSIPLLRMTRRIVGKCEMHKSDDKVDLATIQKLLSEGGVRIHVSEIEVLENSSVR